MARPKLKEGQRGNYRVSRLEQQKRAARRVVQSADRVAKKARTRLAKANEKQANLNQAKRLMDRGGLAVEENIKRLPKAVRETLSENTQILFSPNDGP